MYRVDFSSQEYEYLLRKCPFSEEEKAIIELRRHGKSNIEICRKLSISESTLNRRIKSIVRKIQKEI